MDEIPLPQPPQQPIAQAQSSAQPVAAASPAAFICPRCHFAVKPEYYFCPNCGAKLTESPLATDSFNQLLIYAFSAVLPWIAYLAITKWPGIKYLRSPDERAKQIGWIALIILIISSIIAFWLTYVWIQGYIQSSLNDVNSLGI